MDRNQRKALIEAYKLAFPPMGVFSITNRANGKMLIDQSTNVTAAFNRHRTELRLGTHRNKALMEDWRTYGEANFAFDVLQPIEERPDPGFNYNAELASALANWRVRVPLGSETSYL